MAKVAKVTCPRDGDVLVPVSTLVIDDEDGVYRFTCAVCMKPVDKRLSDPVLDVLRSVGVPTIDEMCSVFAGLLDDEAAVYRGLLAT